MTHPFVAFWWLPFAAGFIVVEAASRAFDRRVLITGFICLALAVTLAAPYWFTVLQLKGHVCYQKRAGWYIRCHDHVTQYA